MDDLRFLWDVPKANISVTDGSGLSMLSTNSTLRLHGSLVNGYHFLMQLPVPGEVLLSMLMVSCFLGRDTF